MVCEMSSLASLIQAFRAAQGPRRLEGLFGSSPNDKASEAMQHEVCPEMRPQT